MLKNPRKINESEKIWNDYHRQLHAFINRKVDDPNMANDILQDVFVKMHTQLPTLTDSSKLKPWLYQITRHAVIDYYRAHKPSEELPYWLSQTAPDTTEEARHELEACLQPMIDRLPTDYREAIVLSELRGMTQQAVSEKIGLSLSGAKSRVQRGRQLLKIMLLDCCRFEFDHRGKVTDYEPNRESCDTC